MTMKKDYVKPEMAIEEVVSQGIIATSPGQTEIPEIDGPGKPWAKEQQGSWGDVWNN